MATSPKDMMAVLEQAQATQGGPPPGGGGGQPSGGGDSIDCQVCGTTIDPSTGAPVESLDEAMPEQSGGGGGGMPPELASIPMM